MNRITVTDRDGWRKEFNAQKAIIYIGSDPANDIVLDGARGAGVAPRHLQLLSLAANGAGYRLVNLGNTDVTLGLRNDRALSPFGSAALKEGDQVRLGDFTLVFTSLDAASVTVVASLPAPSGAPTTVGLTTISPAAPDVQANGSSTGESIGLRLSMPSIALAPDRPLEGTIVVRNQGACPAVQFRLQVEGLDPGWYEIGPGPILFPNAEKEIPIRIIHPRKPSPPAGEFRFSVRASAPEAYPREIASVSQTIHVLPYHSQKVRWLTMG